MRVLPELPPVHSEPDVERLFSVCSPKGRSAAPCAEVEAQGGPAVPVVIAHLRLTAEYPPPVTIGVRTDVYPSDRSIFLTADSDSFVCLGVVDNAIDGGHCHGANPGKISLHSLTEDREK